MIKQIFKYPIEITDSQEISMPIGSEILCVKVQYGKPVIYALVEKGFDEKEKVPIGVFGTGHDIEEDECLGRNTYLGTFLLSNDSLVFHVFRLTE